jgi:uncharacterized membrane protein
MIAIRAGVAGLCALPWLREVPGAPSLFRDVVSTSFARLCHHLPARTLTIRGSSMCVCSRCAGLYAGLALGIALGPQLWRGFRGGARHLRDSDWRRLAGLALGAVVADVSLQDLGMHAPNHAVRLLSGIALGFVVGAWTVDATERTPRSPAPLQRS